MHSRSWWLVAILLFILPSCGTRKKTRRSSKRKDKPRVAKSEPSSPTAKTKKIWRVAEGDLKSPPANTRETSPPVKAKDTPPPAPVQKTVKALPVTPTPPRIQDKPPAPALVPADQGEWEILPEMRLPPGRGNMMEIRK